MFVTFEGIEGAGKSTAMALLSQMLREAGHDPLLTREPGASGLGQRLRPMLLDASADGICPLAELFLFLADRAQHAHEVIGPALAAGRIVLCDRYADSTLAYQGAGRGIDDVMLLQAAGISTAGLRPDLTFLLDLPVKLGLGRAARRNRSQGLEISEGRFDSESESFHGRIRQAYLRLAAAEPDRIAVLDATRSPEEIAARCMATLAPRLKA